MSLPVPLVHAFEESGPHESDPDELLAAAAAAMSHRGFAGETRRIYLTWLRRLLPSSRRGRDEISAEALAGELGRLASLGGLGASSLKQARAAARFLLRVVLARPDDAPILQVPAGFPAPPPAAPTREEVLVLLAACPTARDRLLIGLVYGSGLRLGEALCLRSTDLDLDARRVRVPSSSGRPDRGTVLPPFLMEAAGAHLSGHMPLDWVFMRKDGQRLSRRGAQRAIERAAERCSLGGRIHSRSLRRGFGKAIAEAGKKKGSPGESGAHSETKEGAGQPCGAHSPAGDAPSSSVP